MNQGPIFLTGASRSGKSLLSRVLSLHPNIASHNKEFRMWPRFYCRYGDLSQPANFERCFTAMWSYQKIRAFVNNDSDYIRQKFWEEEPSYGHLFGLFFEYYAQQLGKPRWVDQSQKIERYADAIFSDYPAAKIIHMIRDPRDRYICSKEALRWQRGQEKRIWDFHRDISSWLRSVYLAERNQKRYPDGYKVVRYETLVSQPGQTLHDIWAFLGEADLPLSLLPKSLQGFADDNGENKYDHLSTAYIGCFREVMSGREMAFMQAQAGQAMAAYNYELEPLQLSLKERLLLYLIDWPIGLARKVKRL